jgi:hypothetical protein
MYFQGYMSFFQFFLTCYQAATKRPRKGMTLEDNQACTFMIIFPFLYLFFDLLASEKAHY